MNARTVATTLRTSICLALVIIAGGGCSAHRPSTLVTPDAQRTVVRINNRHWADVRVYLLPSAGGNPVRVGTIPSLATQVIPLRAAYLIEGEVRFLLRPLASRTTYTTEWLWTNQESTAIELMVENNLRLSQLFLSSR